MVLDFWQIWCVAGVIFFIIEVFSPAMFFFNLALACLGVAVIAYLGFAIIWQVLVFGLLSAIFLIWLRPLCIKNQNQDRTETTDMYVGKTATVIEDVNSENGKIAVFGEEWQAKSLNGEQISKGSYVKIVKNDSIVMFVVPAE